MRRVGLDRDGLVSNDRSTGAESFKGLVDCAYEYPTINKSIYKSYEINLVVKLKWMDGLDWVIRQIDDSYLSIQVEEKSTFKALLTFCHY